MTARWPVRELADVCQIKPPKSEARLKLANSELVSFVPMENLGIEQKLLLPRQTRSLGEVNGSYTYFADGDVLLAKITPCFENGKLGIAAALTNGIGFGSSEFIVLRPCPTLDKEYLYYYLSRPEFRGEGEARMGGAVGQQRVPREFVESYPIPLPPLPEQRQIVAILDRAFDAIAIAKANTEKNLANARAVFDSYLESVFRHPAESWIRRRLGELTTKIGSGATPLGGEASYKTEGVPLIRSMNVHDSGFLNRKLAFLADAQAHALDNVIVEPGDVLLNITGASVARCCLAPDEILPARVNQHVSIIRPIAGKLSPSFLHFLLISKSYKQRLLTAGEDSGSTRQALTKALLQLFAIEYPAELSEQDDVVRRLNNLRAKTQHLESVYRRKLDALDVLKKSLLHQAFTGELTAESEEVIQQAIA